MNRQKDPVDHALDSLRSRAWTGEAYNKQLEEQLMQQFHQRQPSAIRRHRALVASLAAMLVGGAGFAAAGGPEAVKGWFVRLKMVGPDGQVIDGVLEPIEGDEGVATLQLDDDTEATVRVQRLAPGAFEAGDYELDQEMMTVLVEVPGDGSAVPADAATAPAGTVTLQRVGPGQPEDLTDRMEAVLRQQKDASAMRTPKVFETIREADVIADWVDDQGFWQELHIVPDGDDEAGGYTLYTTFIDDQDRVMFRRVGAIRGVDPASTEIGDIEWVEAGMATVSFLKADGTDAKITVNLSGQATTEFSRLRMITGDGEELDVNVQSVEDDGETLNVTAVGEDGPVQIKLRPIQPPDQR